MDLQFTSKVEKAFLEASGIQNHSTKIPAITVDNFPKLGLFTSLRFLEWVNENPLGVISLPTGKTPEYFIKVTHYLLEQWNTVKVEKIRGKYGLWGMKKPDLSGLHFVQMDEFYPINPSQDNSFCNYVMKYYLEGFGLDKSKALLINTEDIPLADNRHFLEVFPDYEIDLSLRYREVKNMSEKLQQNSIFLIDNWCNNYEHLIREKGGIGFFLGGIGPDGHIAFNCKGSDHFSSTRLTQTNFETQAVAAGDLGGIEISRKRLVITIGLQTITFNPDTVAIIFAAGEAKADVIKKSLENDPDTLYPATVLQKLKHSRFYLTTGAASKLSDSIHRYYTSGEWTWEKTERAIIDLCQRIGKYGHHLSLKDLKADPYCSLIPDLNETTVQQVIDSTIGKIKKGMAQDREQVIYHTGPHHDDIMLGIMPYTNRQLRVASNRIHYTVLTSGFTAVTNHFIMEVLKDTLHLITRGKIEMLRYSDFFETGYHLKLNKDVYHFLDNVAARDKDEKLRGLCHRVVRALVGIYKIKDRDTLVKTIENIIDYLRSSYDGSINPPEIQKLKGMIREFEEELVWAHFGVQVENVHHLRLGFYTGELFTENPEKERDMLPILNELKKYKPSIISLALDPEGSGPDTHYKVLQSIAGAIKEWKKEEDLSGLRILGYRNVWFRFHPAEVNIIVPVSLNSLDILNSSFSDCYLSQVKASFPSYEYDGKFSELTQRIWVQQLKQVQLLLGKNYFYQNELPLIRASHGLIYIKEMSVDEFISMARDLEKVMEGILI